jgi:hypothetical protein
MPHVLDWKTSNSKHNQKSIIWKNLENIFAIEHHVLEKNQAEPQIEHNSVCIYLLVLALSTHSLPPRLLMIIIVLRIKKSWNSQSSKQETRLKIKTNIGWFSSFKEKTNEWV